jgi:hypothetical protein
VLLAFVVLQAHNLIPHHHSENQSAAQATHDDHEKGDFHDDEDSDHETDHHEFPFTDLAHNADFGKVIAKPHFDNPIIIHPGFSQSLLSELYNRLASFENPPRPRPPDHNSALHLIFLSHSLPLRAPPAFSYLS